MKFSADLLQKLEGLNKARAAEDSGVEAVLKSMETAYRMQTDADGGA